MNKRDQVQQEAIRNLARLSSSHDPGAGEAWVDPQQERYERRRLSGELRSHQGDQGEPENQKGWRTVFVITLLKVLLVGAIFGYGFYGIIMAFIAA